MTTLLATARLQFNRFSRWIRPLIYLIAFIFLAIALVNGWGSVKDYPWQFKPVLMLLALIATALFVLVVVVMTAWLIRRFDLPLPYRSGIEMAVQAYLARYIPGGVWPFASVAATGRDLKLPPSVMVIALILRELVLVLASAVFALPLVFIRFPYLPLELLAVVGLALSLIFAPFLLRWLLNWFVRWRKLSVNIAIERVVSFRGFSSILLVALAIQVLNLFGSVLYLAAVTDFTPMMLLYGALAMNGAWLFGLLVLPAPQGFGAREAAMVFLMLPFVPAPVAIALSLGFRVVTTLVDLGFFLALTAVSARRRVVRIEGQKVP